MKQTTMLKEIKDWADAFGRGNAIKALKDQGLSIRSIEKILSGKYKHRIRQSTILAFKRAGALE